MCVKLGKLTQGYGNTSSTNTVPFMNHTMTKNIPKDQTITYGRIDVKYCPQKSDPIQVRITAGGNLIDYPNELTTRTEDLRTTKMLWNNVVCTKDAKYMCIDIKNMYLATPLDRFEYMRMPVKIIHEEIMKHYDLHQ